MYGDAEPEDAWHPDDPVRVLLDNLSRRCANLGEPGVVSADATEWLAEIVERLERIRRRRLSDMEQVRVAMIAEDIEHIRNRMRDG
ncbi:MAG: hypothetical protein EHM90_00065 [Chloroflexi bacterium]|nr:MAG: hypothetical protein EHM90_06200 [Chloroflexota bacterium]RPH37171.1 MAG: hypothetical protein EHM90_00065 [Chloroflexota bacterium]